MKKTTLLIPMFIVTLGLIACNDEQEEVDHAMSSQGMSIQASTEGDPIAVRSALQGDDQNGYKVVWSKGDKILVGPKVFYLAEGAGTTDGIFAEQSAVQKLADNKKYDVLYGLTSQALPETQDYSADKISNVPMHAQTTVTRGKPSPAKFKNLCGLLRLTIKNEDALKVKNITLSANKPITGPFDMDNSGVIMQNSGGTSITLDCYKDQQGVTITPEGSDFYIVLPPNRYTDVKIVVTNTYNATQAETVSFDIERARITPISLTVDFHPIEGIDLGLPSGLRWASRNIGANKPEEYGKYYAWGETEAKETYTWDSYFDTDCTHYSQAGKTVIDLADDVAHTEWGKNWRMPTYEEIEELVKECYWLWTTSYNDTGVAGYIVYEADDNDTGIMTNENERYSQSPSREYTLSDNHIFLPAAGHHYNSELVHSNSSGYYWSSSLYRDENKRAYNFCFNQSTSDKTYWIYYYYRFYGSSVRAVHEKE